MWTLWAHLTGFQLVGTNSIERNDVNPNGSQGWEPLTHFAGGLGLVLHYIHLCMTETSLQQIFGLVPAIVDHYIILALGSGLHSGQHPEACIVRPSWAKMLSTTAWLSSSIHFYRGHWEHWWTKVAHAGPWGSMMEHVTYNFLESWYYSTRALWLGLMVSAQLGYGKHYLSLGRIILDEILNPPAAGHYSHVPCLFVSGSSIKHLKVLFCCWHMLFPMAHHMS